MCHTHTHTYIYHENLGAPPVMRAKSNNESAAHTPSEFCYWQRASDTQTTRCVLTLGFMLTWRTQPQQLYACDPQLVPNEVTMLFEHNYDYFSPFFFVYYTFSVVIHFLLAILGSTGDGDGDGDGRVYWANVPRLGYIGIHGWTAVNMFICAFVFL